MPFIETKHGKIWAALHRRQRPAPSAILIHGAGGSHLSFPASLRQLNSIQPILIDLPGHGASPGPAREIIADYALDLVALMDALAIKSAIFIGHSMGGAIAQALALEHKTRALALVLLATGARLPVNPALIDSIIADAETTIGKLSSWMWSGGASTEMITRTAEIMRATPPSVIQKDLIACDKFDVSSRLPSIRTPTLLLAAQKDKMTPLALNAKLAAGIPGSTMKIIPNAGHMLQLEQPALTADLIDQWLQGLPLQEIASY